MGTSTSRLILLACLVLSASLVGACVPEDLTDPAENSTAGNNTAAGNNTMTGNNTMAGNNTMVGNNTTTGNNTTAGNMMAGNMTADPNPFAGDTAAAAAGKELFMTQSCGNCHDIDGAAGAVAMKPLSETAQGSSQYIFDTIKFGLDDNPLMSAYGSAIDDTQIWQLTTYVKTL